VKKAVPLLIVLTVLAAVTVISIRLLPAGQNNARQGGRNVRGHIFPGNVGGYNLTDLVEGEAAQANIEMLHGGVGIEVTDAFVATYTRDRESFILWISVSGTEDDAHYLLDIMDEKIPASTVFTNRQVLQTESNTYYYVTGAGMENFYWVEGTRVFWVGIMAQNLMEALQLIINNF